MSADNYVGVYHDQRDGKDDWVVCHGSMSLESFGSVITRQPNRPAALEAAHDVAKEMEVLEYGVIELNPRRDVS